MTILPINLVDRVAEILTRYSMLTARSRVGVAVSGGADSISLLHVFHRLAGPLELSLAVLHVNHQLRGEESDEDEAFVRSLAAGLGWPCFGIRAPSSSGNLEGEARTVRYDFFMQVRNSENLDRIALGHTLSDQAETVLFRLLRGSGTAGLAAMRPVRGPYIRPLLTTSRDEVRAWASAENIAWREDRTNLDPQFARNRLRLETLPELKRHYNPNVENVLAATASVAQAEEDFWTELAVRSFRSLRHENRWGFVIDAGAMNELPLALRRRLIRQALSELRGDLRGLDIGHIESIVNVCASSHGHDRVMIPGADILRSFDSVLFAVPGALNEQRQYRVPIEIGVDCALPYDAGVVRLDDVTEQGQFCVKFKNERHFLRRIAAGASGTGPPSLAVRNWRPGDELKRAGHRKPEKIKSLFQEHRIVLWERKHWPVLVLGEEIVWTRQFGCGERFEAQPDDLAPALRLTFREAAESAGFTSPI